MNKLKKIIVTIIILIIAQMTVCSCFELCQVKAADESVCDDVWDTAENFSNQGKESSKDITSSSSSKKAFKTLGTAINLFRIACIIAMFGTLVFLLIKFNSDPVHMSEAKHGIIIWCIVAVVILCLRTILGTIDEIIS